MESLLALVRMHWDYEALAVPRQTESADKSDALQTLRAVRRRPAVAKRLECVRLQRRFPKPGYDSMTGQVHGKSPELLEGKSSFAQSGGLFSRYNLSPAFGTGRMPSSSRFAKSSTRIPAGSR